MARTPAEYVELLRRLKDHSGLTYRQIQGRAEALGEVLPKSTLAGMLGRAALPREELVRALVRVCDDHPETVTAWIAARKRLASKPAVEVPVVEAPVGTVEPGGGVPVGPETASAGPAVPSTAPAATPTGWPAAPPTEPAATSSGGTAPGGAPPSPAEEISERSGDTAPGRWESRHPPEEVPAWWRRRSVRMACAAVVGLGVVAGAVGIGVAVLDGDAQEASPSSSPPSASAGAGRASATVAPPDPPASGPYRIRVEHTGLCLSENPSKDDGQLYQRACPQSFPPMSLERLDDGTYRVRASHPRFGPGCLAVDDAGGPPVGAPVTNSDCGERGTEFFRLEPVTAPLPGFRIHPVHSDLCLGIVGDATAPWAPVRQVTCGPAAAGQVFTFVR